MDAALPYTNFKQTTIVKKLLGTNQLILKKSDTECKEKCIAISSPTPSYTKSN